MDVGAAKRVDRLLGIADHEEPVAVVTSDEDAAEDLPLQVVGVLEFIDEAEAKALAQRMAASATPAGPSSASQTHASMSS
jgi:hypothetical protein